MKLLDCFSLMFTVLSIPTSVCTQLLGSNASEHVGNANTNSGWQNGAEPIELNATEFVWLYHFAAKLCVARTSEDF